MYHKKVLNRYILQQFFRWFFVVLSSSFFVILLFSTVEFLRKSQTHLTVTFSKTVKMALLQMPTLMDEMMPFIMLVTAMLTLWSLHKRSEIIVMRSLGCSIWSLVYPMILGVMVYSVCYFFFLNPFATSMQASFLSYQQELFHKSNDFSSVSKSGLWLKHQKVGMSYSIIHVEKILNNSTLGPTVIYDFGSSGLFLRRYDVQRVRVHPQEWVLEKPVITESDNIQHPYSDLRLPIRLTLHKIEKTFQSPETISFWELPQFIRLIEHTGLSGVRHVIYFFNVLIKPFLWASMILLGGVCAFGFYKKRDGLLFVLFGIGAGFFFHFLNQIFFSLAEALKVPPFFAALTPVLISFLVGLILLIHLEER